MSAGDEGVRLRRLSPEEILKDVVEDSRGIEATVADIVAETRSRGDAALREYARKFDGCELASVRASLPGRPDAAAGGAPEEVRALASAAARVRRFAEAQMAQFRDFSIEAEEGVFLGQRVDALDSVGVYVPGGRYPLVSSALMCVIPAKVAGVKRVVVMSPPMRNGEAHPMVLLAAAIAGADEFYVSGGAQGVAALAYGTESVRPVDKIVGPGNAYVSTAKRFVAADVGIDFYAGPSEVLVVADDGADAALAAVDLAAQAEHDPMARPLLIAFSERKAAEIERELGKLLEGLPTAAIARSSAASRGATVIVKGMEEAAKLASALAPEHLELHVSGAKEAARLFRNYGSVFLGGGAAEALGDYAAGINHTLPTRRAARYSSGLSVKDFICLRTSLDAKPGAGLDAIARDAASIARMERLAAHAAAARARIERR